MLVTSCPNSRRFRRRRGRTRETTVRSWSHLRHNSLKSRDAAKSFGTTQSEKTSSHCSWSMCKLDPSERGKSSSFRIFGFSQSTSIEQASSLSEVDDSNSWGLFTRISASAVKANNVAFTGHTTSPSCPWKQSRSNHSNLG